jgi:hypothetical protein
MESLKVSIKERVRILIDELKFYAKQKPLVDEGLMGNLREAFDSYRYTIRQKMIEESLKLEKAIWHYNGCFGFFLKRNEIEIALVLPKSGVWVKYIHAKTENGKDIIAALPFQFHIDIVEAIEKVTGEKLKDIKGGFIKIEKKITFILYGASRSYGKADHEKVASILNKLLNEFGLTVKVDDFSD